MSDKKKGRKSADVSHFIKENAALLHNLRSPLLSIKAYANHIVRSNDEAGDLPLNIERQVNRINRELDQFWASLEEEYPEEFEKHDEEKLAELRDISKGLITKPKLKVLVVDDDELHRDIIARLIVQKGHEVSISTGGMSALSLFQLEDFDLVIVDIHMPGTDGLAVAKHIKSETGELDRPFIIGISNDPRTTEMITQTNNAGMNAYIEKPITAEKLERFLSVSE